MDKDIRVFIDFGSTFTKVVAVDLDNEEIVARTRAPSTVATDITFGLREALDRAGIGELDGRKALACSSAAGGLRMVCVGFVPEYTSAAANLAALGAGAKVVGRFSYELEEREVREIEELAPDIVLLTGGTDGGNTRVILRNARQLARTGGAVTNIVVAGNKAAYDEIRTIFDCRKRVIFTRNVMPEIGRLDLAPCNARIRELFLENIVQAKGIARARSIIREVIMPTPAAVMEAAALISCGAGAAPGFGELLVVDTGGATTDVVSIASGAPRRSDIMTIGLPEPYEKRSVEGDLGLKYNLETLLEMLAGRELPPHFEDAVGKFREGGLPETDDEVSGHRLLTRLAVEIAVGRHAGRVEEAYGPAGRMFVQRGKDLTAVDCVIGTGGALVFAANPGELLEAARSDADQPAVLKPEAPQLWLDGSYILFAVGLLGQSEPEKAVRLAWKYLEKVDPC
jgi:uncharacterized protein (TIGR01319 family)